MKTFLLCLFTFAVLALATASAQTAAPIPGVDPAIQQVVTEALPAKYASYGSAFILGIMIFGRFLTALANGRGIKGWLSAIINGTNGPKVLIATFCLLSLPACSTPEQNARLGQLVNLAVDVAVKRGALTPDDAAAIRQAETIILPAPAPKALPAKQPLDVQP
jgi:hypothetical protein